MVVDAFSDVSEHIVVVEFHTDKGNIVRAVMDTSTLDVCQDYYTSRGEHTGRSFS